MEEVIEFKNVSKHFADFEIADLNFSIPRGYITGFIGPNGAGKTTTIKLIMGLANKDKGQINVFGMNNEKYSRQIKEKIGFVYDENHYYEHLKIPELKRIIARFYHNWSNEAFERYRRDFELPTNKKLKEFSRGMKTKFSLAMALSHGAELIIMDEPTSGLDPVFRSELLDILAGIMQDGEKSVLFSTHITTDLEKTADYICFINQGKLVFNHSKDEVLQRYAIVKGPLEALTSELRKLLIGIRENNFGFEALSRYPKDIKSLMGEKILVEPANLEQIMVYTVRGEKSA